MQRPTPTVPSFDSATSWTYFKELVDRLTDGVTVQNAAGALVYANELGARISGYASPDELLAAPVGDYSRAFEVMDVQGAPLGLEQLPGRVALRDGHGHRVLRVRDRATAEERYMDVRAFVLHSPSGAQFVVNLIRDVSASIDALQAAESATRREGEARRRAEFLSHVTALLGGSPDYHETLEHVAESAVPTIADWCAIDLVNPGTGGLERLCLAPADPNTATAGLQMHPPFAPDAMSADGVAKVLRTGRAELYERVSEDMLIAWAGDDEHCREVRQLSVRSAMLVPLRVGERIAGVLRLLSAEDSRSYNADDLAFAVELGRRIGAAIERSELYSAATEHAKWLARVQQATVGLSRAVTFTDAIDTATNLGRRLFEADAVGVWLRTSDRQHLDLSGSYGASPWIAEGLQRMPILGGYPLNEVMATGEPLIVTGADAIAARFPALADTVNRNGIAALANAAIKVGGEIIGVLSFRYHTPTLFTADFVTALRTFSKELGQALERTRIHSALEEAKKAAEAANAAKSAFLATMSHELRTPINAILGFTELIELGIGSGQTSTEFVGRIRANTEHLLELINDILDWSKVEAGQFAIESATSPAADVISDTAAGGICPALVGWR